MEEQFLYVDIETRSTLDVRTAGLSRYANDAPTEPIIVCWALNDEPVQRWDIHSDDPEAWLEFEELLADESLRLVAFNASFESMVLDVAADRWECAGYQARLSNMPGSLSGCSRALGTAAKASTGNRLISKFCKPIPGTVTDTSNGEYHLPAHHPDDWQAFIDYCADDVEALRDIHKALPRETPRQRDYWLDNEAINDTGIGIDVELASAAVITVANINAKAARAIYTLTDGATDKARGIHLTNWVYENLDATHQAMMKRPDGRKTLDKTARRTILESELLGQDDKVRHVLEEVDLVGNTSVGKFSAMLDRSDRDGRVRHSFVAAGASATGRFSSRGLQLHNFSRNVVDNPEEVRQWIMSGDINFKPAPVETLTRMLRAALIPEEGHSFAVADWSAIEGRVAPWLFSTEDCPEAETAKAKLELFREGADIYVHTATDIYPTLSMEEAARKEYRQVGKVAELALQYQGHVGAFNAMAGSYGLSLPLQTVECVITAWRNANAWAPAFWMRLETAVRKAYFEPEQLFHVGRIQVGVLPRMMQGRVTKWLYLFLPGGNHLCYPDLRIEGGPRGDQITALRAAFKPGAKDKEWPRAALYGGLLVENVTQGFAAELLKTSINALMKEYVKWRTAGLEAKVVAHVHDEIIVEYRDGEFEEPAAAELEWAMTNHSQIMEIAPGLPLKAEAQYGLKRYGK